MISGTRGFGAYTFFAIFCALSAVWTYFAVPETKGRSLEDMDRVFGDNASEADATRRAEIYREMKGQYAAVASERKERESQNIEKSSNSVS